MEILKGFTFQIQRFAGETINIAMTAGATDAGTVTAAAHADLATAVAALAAGTSTTCYLNASAALTTGTPTLSFSTTEGANVVGTLTKSGDAYTLALTGVTDGVFTFSSLTLGSMGSLTITVGEDADVDFAFTGIAKTAKSLKVGAGSTVLAATDLVLQDDATVAFNTTESITVKDGTSTNSLTLKGKMSVVESVIETPSAANAVTSMAAGSEVSGVGATAKVGTVATSVNGTYKINGVSYTTSQTTGALTFTADASDVSGVTGITNGSTFSTTDSTGLTVETATSGIAKYSNTSSERGKVTVGGTLYESGSDAAQTMSFYINSSGTPLLVSGTVYLSQGKSVKGINATNGTGSAVTITADSGDINVNMSSGTAIAVTDLDNGDTFTVSGPSTYTYSVVNGSLVCTTTGAVLSNATTNTLSSSDVPDMVLGWTTTDYTTATTATVIGTAQTKSENKNSSVGSSITAPDVTNISLTVNSDDTGAVRTVTQFVNSDYLHKNGVVSSDSTDAVGQLAYNSSSEIVTYEAVNSAKGQTIALATDNNYSFDIKGTANADNITGLAGTHTLEGGAGNDVLSAANNNTLLGGDGNDSLFGATATNISLVGGAGVDSLAATTTTASLTGGDGADVFVLNDAGTYAAGKGVITDYNFAEDVLYSSASTVDEMKAIKAANVSEEGKFAFNGGDVTISSSSGNYQVVVQNADKKKQVVGWVGENGTGVDFSSQTAGTVIIGTVHTSGDSLYGGSGADTIYGGSGDTIYGGAGKNTIDMTSTGDNARTLGFGVTSGTGKDTVTGFANGFDTETKDNLYLVGDASSLAVTLSGTTLDMKMGNASMELQGVTVGTNSMAEVLFGDAKAAFIASGNTGVVSEADYASYYWGTKNGTVKSGLNFSALDSDVEVNLSDTTTYRNISSLTGGSGNTTLMGSSEKETLVSGGGNTSLWGGAGNDVLQGKSGAKDMFFLLSGSGKDTVTSFEAYTESTSDTADVLYVSDLTSAKAVSGAVELATSDGSKFTLNGLTNNSEIQYTTDGTNIAIAKLGSVSAANSFTYASEVNFYGGGSKVDSLTVSGSDNAAIWLDNSKGGSVTYSSIEVVNGQSAQGDLLIAGNESVNTLIAGRGDASLWGGSGNTKDYLKGSTNGTTQFFYGYGEGNDTIVSSNADDVVNLLNITLANINGAATEITSSGVTLGMNDGSKLTVQTTKDITFSLADGSKYTANHNDKSWS